MTWHYNTGGMHTIMLHIHKMQYVTVHTHTLHVATLTISLYFVLVSMMVAFILFSLMMIQLARLRERFVRR